MAIAPTLATCLEQAGIQPEILTHDHTPSASRTAQATHVSGDRVAKAVLLKDDTGYLLAVLPASHHLRLDAVEVLTGRSLTLAAEEEIGRTFPDCEVGAVPPVGTAYGLPAVVDDSLVKEPEVYLEGGDHTTLVRVTQEDFAQLMQGAQAGVLSLHQ
jgi:Ala-tRNA(Pro) deacylase